MQINLRRMLAALVASVYAAVSSVSTAAEFHYDALNFSVTTDDRWSMADADIVKSLTLMTSPSALVHARFKGVSATPKAIDSAVLLIYSKLPFGTPGDNPNIILAKEKAWAKQFEKSGAGYIKLMQERVWLTKAPTKFIGEPEKVKIGDVEFHQIDAMNTKVTAFETKQRYVCTYKNDYYIYFVLSYNDNGDADFIKMMEVVKSFHIPKR